MPITKIRVMLMKETKLKVNCGLVFSCYLEDVLEVISFIEERQGKVIFIKKSVGKLWIKEGEQ